MAAFKVLLVVLVLHCISKQGDALKCYECGGTRDCNDDFVSGSDDVSTASETDCEYCFKRKIYDGSSGKHTVSRGCAYSTSSETIDGTGCITCHDQNDGESCKTTEINCYCDGDDCNHGNTIMAAPLMLLLVAFVYKFILV